MSCKCHELSNKGITQITSNRDGTVYLVVYSGGVAINFEYEEADQDIFIKHCPFCGRELIPKFKCLSTGEYLDECKKCYVCVF